MRAMIWLANGGNRVRGAWRFFALFAVIFWTMVTYVVGRSDRRDTRSKALWLQRACRRSLKVIGVQIESRGPAAQGAVIVANHLSYLDILVMAALTPVVFVSKKEVRHWPIFGWFAEKAGTRFIDRNKRGDVMRISEEIGPVMAAGLTIVIFLEGTTTDGAGVLPFKASLLEPVVQNRWPVVPAALVYLVPEGRSAAMEVCWWADMTLAPHLLNFMTLPWVRAQVAWGALQIAAGDRKTLAEALRAEVVRLKASLEGR
jgi:lyso-ornithine lipid O-acyltransferase